MEQKRKRGRPRKNPIEAPVDSVVPKEEVKKSAISPKRTKENAVVMEAQKDAEKKPKGKHIIMKGGQPTVVEDSEDPELY